MEAQMQEQQGPPEEQAPQATPWDEPDGEEGTPIQNMLLKTIPAHKRKFKGRTGGRTPDWRDKSPLEERDIDEWAEARSRNNMLTLMEEPKTWVSSLIEKGFDMPFIKEVSPDGKQMWFMQDSVDYIAHLNGSGVVHVEKAKPDPAVHSPFNQSHQDRAMYNPTGAHRQHPNNYDEEEEDVQF